MKHLILLILLFISYFGFNQNKLSLDEVKFNINYSHPTNLINFNPKLGIGVGVYNKFRKEKITNFMIGLEYNYTTYTNASVTESSLLNFTKKENIEINYHSITLPFLFKINATKIFYTKLGVLLDFNFLIKEKGIVYNNVGHSNNNTIEQSNYNNVSHYFTPSLGFDFGVGVNFSKLIFSTIGYSYFINNNNIYHRVSSFNLSLGLKF